MRRGIGLGLVLGCLAVTLVLAYGTKAACASGEWTGQQYTTRCYTDIIPLLGTEELEGDRLPFLEPCRGTQPQCDEYPVLTMYAMRVAAWVSDDLVGFFLVNVALLAIAALGVVLLLHRTVGDRALYVAAAPTLMAYAYMNWDLFAVVAATAASVLALRRRDAWAGILFGIGVAAKLYPGLLLAAFLLERLRERDGRGAGRLAVGAAGSWLAVNLPFALLAPDGWSRFFRFSAERTADWDSLWFLGCYLRSGTLGCTDTALVNTGVAIAFVVSAAVVYALKVRREPDFPRWTFAFPLLALFLLTGKVYSPQFSLWLLPLFALVLPDVSLFLLFSIADVAVFLTRFSWFATYSGDEGVPLEAFLLSVGARALVLAACVVVWVLRPAVDAAPPSVAPPPRTDRPDPVPA